MSLFVSDVPLSCINQAAATYHIPAMLIIAVLNVERGKAGMAIKNKNGTYDLGPMQINTSWWPKLNQYGVSQYQIQYDACMNISVGTWILAKNIAKGHDLLTSIGDYHSHTDKYNFNYQQKVRLYYSIIKTSCDNDLRMSW